MIKLCGRTRAAHILRAKANHRTGETQRAAEIIRKL